jgi:hypothetical protein
VAWPRHTSTANSREGNPVFCFLDNHDDFGGHAKRNEFQAGKRLLLGYGGTQSIEAPGNYSKESIGLLQELGIEVTRFYKYYDQKLFDSMHLTEAVFFDKETFGVDRLVPQKGLHYFGVDFTLDNISQIPIAEQARKDLVRLQQASVDYMPELTPERRETSCSRPATKISCCNMPRFTPMWSKCSRPRRTIYSPSALTPFPRMTAPAKDFPASRDESPQEPRAESGTR